MIHRVDVSLNPNAIKRKNLEKALDKWLQILVPAHFMDRLV